MGRVEHALERMIGGVVEVGGREARAARVIALLERARRESIGKRDYKRDFASFLFELVKTKDEARGGIVRGIERAQYIEELIEIYMTSPLVLVEKSRRVLASWVTCAFDVWVAAGGQDERWPALCWSDKNRQVIIASRKLRDTQGSSWFLQNRVRYIVEELERGGIRERWEDFPYWEWTATEARLSNGSYINAIASGADQARGAGATLVHAEEIAFWPDAQRAVEGILPVLIGGGHLIAITTPQAGTYAHRIVQGAVEVPLMGV
ncbi:MAG: hypothetical protein V2G41_10100 [bacterium JZ-2024 1]